MEKKEIRKQYKMLRNKMSEMEVKEKSDRICQNIISSNLFQQAEKMLVYAPLGNEVDICPVMEPVETNPIDWEEALVLVPGVAFDRQGSRMGYGKGYYDRFFEGKTDCVKVGVAYELQVADQLPTEENDLPMEYLVTEKGVWKRQ